MDEQFKVGFKRFRRLRRRLGRLVGFGLTKVLFLIPALYRLKSGLVNLPLVFLSLCCGFLLVSCANADDPSAKQSQHHQHHRGTYGQGQTSDGSYPSRSGTPIPGL